MSISVRTRFEVFKRDRYTCTYCGNHPPDVLLEVDHVTPRAAGGTDEMENLTTACWDCNRGKSDRLLDEGGRPAVSKKTVAALEERLEQAKAYVDLLSQLSDVTDAMLDRVQEHWAKAFYAQLVEKDDGTVWRLTGGGTWPKPATVRKFLRDIGLEDVLEAIDAAASRVGDAPGNDRYFYKVCWRMFFDKQRASQAGQPHADVDRLNEENLQLLDENIRLRSELADTQEILEDLRLNVRRLRDEAGRR